MKYKRLEDLLNFLIREYLCNLRENYNFAMIKHMKTMKSILLGVCISLFLGSAASAQITLDISGHPADAGVIERGKLLKPGSLFIPDLGANKTYDYRAALLTGDSIQSKVYIKTTDLTHYPGSNRNFAESITYNGLSFFIDQYESNNTSAHALMGYGMKRQAFDISSTTGTSGDSVIFPKQDHLCTQNETILAYPASYKSNWNYADRLVVNFILNAHAFILNYDNVPGKRVLNVTHYDTIVGWGKMNVPLDSTGSGSYDVLLVKSWEKTVDSLYLRNKPASDTILGVFGINNGAVTYTYSYRFYRPFYSPALMNIVTNSQYSKVNSAYYDPDHIGMTGIASMASGISGISVYPNPSANGNFNLSLDKSIAGNYSLNIINSLGQKVMTKILSGTGHQNVNIQLPESAPAGIYFYGIMNEKGEVLSTGKLIK